MFQLGIELENISEIIFVNKVDLVFVIKLLITIQCYDSSTETFIRREEGQIKRRHKSVDYTVHILYMQIKSARQLQSTSQYHQNANDHRAH